MTMFHKSYEEWNASLEGRPADEAYDIQRDVEKDPCGAWWAIQFMAMRIRQLEGQLELAVDKWPLADGKYLQVHDSQGRVVKFLPEK